MSYLFNSQNLRRAINCNYQSHDVYFVAHLFPSFKFSRANKCYFIVFFLSLQNSQRKKVLNHIIGSTKSQKQQRYFQLHQTFIVTNKILLHFSSSFKGSQIIIHLFIFKLTKVIKGIFFFLFSFWKLWRSDWSYSIQNLLMSQTCKHDWMYLVTIIWILNY